jgi:hypothetical protein
MLPVSSGSEKVCPEAIRTRLVRHVGGYLPDQTVACFRCPVSSANIPEGHRIEEHL